MTAPLQIGGATLYCGDALDILPRLDPVDAVFADPPYSSGGMFRGDRTTKTSEKYQSSRYRSLYAEFSGDSRDQRSYAHWSALWLSAALRLTRPSGVCGVFTDWRQLPTTTDAIQAGGWVWRGLVVWDKTEAARPQKGRYRNQCEYVVWGSNGVLPADGPVLPGLFRHVVSTDDKHHMAGKPVAVLRDLLRITRRGATVLDPFMGSGTTGVAAARLGRRFVGIELEPTHFETACRRIDDAYRQGGLFVEPRAVARQPDLLGGAPC